MKTIAHPPPVATNRLQHDKWLIQLIGKLDRSLKRKVETRASKSGHPVEDKIACWIDGPMTQGSNANGGHGGKRF